MSYLMQTYGRFDVTFVRGDGVFLFDGADKKYLDFASGIGVNSVGYAHPEWVAAVSDQAGKLAHVSNLYHTLPGEKLAEKLAEKSGLCNVFFANSGAEANEGAIKLARKYNRDKYGDSRPKIATLLNSFHGRTVTTLSATGQDSFHTHFDPFTPGFVHIPAENVQALRDLPSDVGAIMLEVVQGEGGVIPLSREYLAAVREICAERDILLICDEVQTGIGRTGKWFGFQHYGITPDIVSFAKGIAGGLPLGGIIAGEKCRDVFTPGTHATTFGANPICCAAALKTLEILEKHLPDIAAKEATVREFFPNARGLGLMLGIPTAKTPRDVVIAALGAGLVCLTAGRDVVRLLPPLIITQTQLRTGLNILKGLI